MPFRNRIEFNRQPQFPECIDYPFQSKGVEFKNKSSNKRDTGHASLREQPVWSHREWDLGCTHILLQNSPWSTTDYWQDLKASKSMELKLILAFPHPHLLVVYFFLSLSISLWSFLQCFLEQWSLNLHESPLWGMWFLKVDHWRVSGASICRALCLTSFSEHNTSVFETFQLLPFKSQSIKYILPRLISRTLMNRF